MPRVIITVPEKNAQPYRFQLDRSVVTLGRGSENDIVLDSGSVSTKHAVMKRVDGGYELVDLGSTNGIRAKGQRMTKVPLVSGMILQLGEVSFDFTLTDEELTALASEKPMLPPMPEETETKPKAKKRTVVEEEEQPRVYEMESVSPGVSLIGVLTFLVFAVFAFGVGAEVRHRRDTDESLLNAIQAKEPAVEAAPTSGKKEIRVDAPTE